jgi:hypothetical protein
LATSLPHPFHSGADVISGIVADAAFAHRPGVGSVADVAVFFERNAATDCFSVALNSLPCTAITPPGSSAATIF